MFLFEIVEICLGQRLLFVDESVHVGEEELLPKGKREGFVYCFLQIEKVRVEMPRLEV